MSQRNGMKVIFNHREMQVTCLENINQAYGIEQFGESSCDKAFGTDDKLHMNQRYNGATKNANADLGCINRIII